MSEVRILSPRLMIGWSVAALLALGAAFAPGARADEREAQRLLDAGTALFDAGSFDAAREAFVKARDLAPDKANPHRWLGITDARLGRCAEAIAELDDFIARVPRSDRRLLEVERLRTRCAA